MPKTDRALRDSSFFKPISRTNPCTQFSFLTMSDSISEIQTQANKRPLDDLPEEGDSSKRSKMAIEEPPALPTAIPNLTPQDFAEMTEANRRMVESLPRGVLPPPRVPNGSSEAYKTAIEEWNNAPVAARCCSLCDRTLPLMPLPVVSIPGGMACSSLCVDTWMSFLAKHHDRLLTQFKQETNPDASLRESHKELSKHFELESFDEKNVEHVDNVAEPPMTNDEAKAIIDNVLKAEDEVDAYDQDSEDSTVHLLRDISRDIGEVSEKLDDTSVDLDDYHLAVMKQLDKIENMVRKRPQEEAKSSEKTKVVLFITASEDGESFVCVVPVSELKSPIQDIKDALKAGKGIKHMDALLRKTVHSEHKDCWWYGQKTYVDENNCLDCTKYEVTDALHISTWD
jgi:hypothetical protein